MFAAPAWVTEAGIIFGTLLTFTGFMGVVLKSKVGRWLAQEITEDVTGWIDGRVKAVAPEMIDARLDEMLPKHLEPVLYELRTNGGGSFRDDVNGKLSRLDAFMAESSRDREGLHAENRELTRLFHDAIRRDHHNHQGEQPS